MTGYSDNRGKNLEVKYLRKVLGAVDSRIELPDSLRGQSLLRSLEGVEQEIPTEKKVRELVLPRRPSLRSWMTYAAAFVLVVGLFYGLGFHRPNDLTMGKISINQNSEAAQLGQGGGAPGINAEDENSSAIMVAEGVPGAENPSPDSAASPDPAGLSPAEITPFGAAVGGSGMGVRLGEFGEYVLSYRPNDATDPDHISEAPNVLLLLGETGDVIISQLDIPHMAEITGYYSDGPILVLLGRSEDTVYICSVDCSDAENPTVAMLLEQPGELAAEYYFDGFLYVASHSPESVEIPESAIVLEDSVQEGACVLTLINLSEADGSQISVVGAGKEVKLHRTEARIPYTALGEDGQAQEERIAKVDIFIGALQMSLAGTEAASAQ